MIIGRNNLTIVSHDFPVRSPRTLAFGGRKFPRNLIHFFVVWHFYEKKKRINWIRVPPGGLVLILIFFSWKWIWNVGAPARGIPMNISTLRRDCFVDLIDFCWNNWRPLPKMAAVCCGGSSASSTYFFFSFVDYLLNLCIKASFFFPAWLLAFCCRVPPVGPDGRRSPPEFFRFVDLCLFCPWPALNEPDMQMSSLARTVRATWLAV